LHRKLRPTHGVVITLQKARELLAAEGREFMDSISADEPKQRGALGVVPIIYQLSFSEDTIRATALTIPPLHLIKAMQARDNWGVNWVNKLQVAVDENKYFNRNQRETTTSWTQPNGS